MLVNLVNKTFEIRIQSRFSMTITLSVLNNELLINKKNEPMTLLEKNTNHDLYKSANHLTLTLKSDVLRFCSYF